MSNSVGVYQINSIIDGDCRDLTAGIPAESIDLILCDPVYWEIEQYVWLVEISGKILKPGGNLIAQAGNEYLGKCWCAMNAEPQKIMFMRPILVETFSGGLRQHWKHRSLIGYHPYIWMTKGETITREGWVHDTVKGGGREKSDHDWGDSVDSFLNWIQVLTEPEDIIFDPFTGSGTVPAAAKTLGRNYLAFEIDPITAEKARKRLSTTQPPLFSIGNARQTTMEFIDF